MQSKHLLTEGTIPRARNDSTIQKPSPKLFDANKFYQSAPAVVPGSLGALKQFDKVGTGIKNGPVSTLTHTEKVTHCPCADQSR
jgi:hypothetical protein